MKKKIVFLSCVLVILGIFGGCSIFGGDDADLSTLEGILTEQTVTDGYPGTHILTDDVGTVTPLTSISVKLSDPQYLNNKVEVTGKLNDDKIFEVKSILLVALVDQTYKPGEFVSYENGILGFKIKYYSDWQLTEGTDSLTLRAPTKNGVINSDQISISKTVYNYLPTTPTSPVTLKVNSDNFTDQVKPDATSTTTPAVTPATETPLSSYFAKMGKSDLIMKKIGPDNIDAVFMDDGFNRLDYYVYRPGYVYKISFIPSVSNYLVDNKTIFTQIVAEFKFVDFGTEIKNEASTTLSAVQKEVFLPKMDVDTKPVTDKPATGIVPPPVNTTPGAAASLPTSVPVLSDVTFATFTSVGFKFSVDYPKNWYFAGNKSEAADAAFYFNFSNNKPVKDQVDPTVQLDIYTGAMPKTDPRCSVFNLGNSNESYVCYSEVQEVYVKAGNKTFRLETTDPKYTDIMLNMAASIESVE